MVDDLLQIAELELSPLLRVPTALRPSTAAKQGAVAITLSEWNIPSLRCRSAAQGSICAFPCSGVSTDSKCRSASPERLSHPGSRPFGHAASGALGGRVAGCRFGKLRSLFSGGSSGRSLRPWLLGWGMCGLANSLR